VVTVRTGKEALRRLNEAADIDAVIVDHNVPDPLLPYFLGQVRSDLNSGLLPVLVITPPDREASLSKMTERYRNVYLVPLDFARNVDGALEKILPVFIAESIGKPMDEAEQKAVTERALMWLAKIARGEKKGFDVRGTIDSVVEAVKTNKLSSEAMLNAVDILGRAAGDKAQMELANILADGRQSGPVRLAAAQELVRHIQTHGVRTSDAQVKVLREIQAATDTEPGLKAQIAAVLGNLRPDARTSGTRLSEFKPAPPQPLPPPPPMPMPIKPNP
jgi:CheY-like chemotaxis protein